MFLEDRRRQLYNTWEHQSHEHHKVLNGGDSGKYRPAAGVCVRSVRTDNGWAEGVRFPVLDTFESLQSKDDTSDT